MTTVLKMLPSDNLIDWAARCGADEAVNCWDQLAELPLMERHNRIRYARNHVRDAAAKRGTEVHRLAGRLVDGEPVRVPDELAGHVEAYRDWLDRVDPAPLEGGTELVVASRAHHYCGTVDLIADLPDIGWDAEIIPACRWLLELKTTASGVWPESAIQACAYSRAELFGVEMEPCGACDPETRIMTGPRGGMSKCEQCHPERAGLDERPMDWLKIARCGVVWIKSDTCELRPVETGDEVWEMFLRLRWLHERKEAMRGWVGGAAYPADVLSTT